MNNNKIIYLKKLFISNCFKYSSKTQYIISNTQADNFHLYIQQLLLLKY